MFAILDKFWISLTVVLVTSQQGVTIYLKVFVADQILIGRCFKGFEWSWYFEEQTEYSFECKMISFVKIKILCDFCCDVTCISIEKLKIVDISFLSIKTFVEVRKIWKNGKRVLYIVLKDLSNELENERRLWRRLAMVFEVHAELQI
jgi:hypothetical protein